MNTPHRALPAAVLPEDPPAALESGAGASAGNAGLSTDPGSGLPASSIPAPAASAAPAPTHRPSPRQQASRQLRGPERRPGWIPLPIVWAALAVSVAFAWAVVRPQHPVGAGWLWGVAAVVAALVVSSTGRPPREIHDDQLDRILTVEALVLAVWLAASGSGWGHRGASVHAVAAMALFAAAAMFALVGTRMVYRLRWPLAVAVASVVPVLRSWPCAVIGILLVLAWSARRLRSGPRLRVWVPQPAVSRMALVLAGAAIVVLVGRQWG